MVWFVEIDDKGMMQRCTRVLIDEHLNRNVGEDSAHSFFDLFEKEEHTSIRTFVTHIFQSGEPLRREKIILKHRDGSYSQWVVEADYAHFSPLNTRILLGTPRTPFTDISEYAENYLSRAEEAQHFTNKLLHDMKSPLNILRSFLDLSVKSIEGNTPDQALLFLRRCQERAQQLRVFLETYAKLFPYAVDLHSFTVQSLCVGAQQALKKKYPKITMALEMDEGCAQPFLAQDTLPFIFEELLENALKFRDPTKKEVSVVVECQPTESDILIHVESSGIAIEEGDVASMQKPFVRCHALQIPGNGLGLFVVDFLMSRMGGSFSTLHGLGQTKITLKIPKQTA